MSLGHAAIVTIGTELARGLRVDTNGPALARALCRLGFSVDEKVSVGDDPLVLTELLKNLTTRYELVISTGGLGPTHDDITRQAAADALGLRMDIDEGVYGLLRPFADRVSDPCIRDEIYQQALVIHGAELIRAIAGTAPAQCIPTAAGHLLILPGPPREMRPLLDVFLGRYADRCTTSIDFSCFGINESKIQHIVQPLIADEPQLLFTVLASPQEVHVILVDTGCGAVRLKEVSGRIRVALGDMVFSETGEDLAEVVDRIAIRRGLTIATAESCTGGLVVGALTAMPGSSQAVLGGVVSYANDVKVHQLGVSPHTLDTYGAVSSQCACEMADGVRGRLGSDLAVSVTGIAGPAGGTSEKPVGTVWFAVASSQGVIPVLSMRGGATRADIRIHSVSIALDLLRRTLLGLPLEHAVDGRATTR